MQHVQVYRYCVTLACGDEPAARAATLEAFRAAAERDAGEDGPAALFTLARAAVKAELRQRKATGVPAAGTLYAARPALDEQHWNLLALILPEYADRPRHRQVDLAAVAAAAGKKVDVTRKAVDRLVEPGGHLDVAMFTADATAAATDGGAGCRELATIVTTAKRLRPAVRKAVAAHLPTCATCTAALEARPSALAVLSALPIPAVPDDLAALDLAALDLAALDLAAPDLAAPDLAALDLAAPDLAAPGLPAPDTAAPEPAAPEPAAPEPAALDAAAAPAAPETGDDTDVTVELLPVAGQEAAPDDDRPLSTVYYPVPAVASVRLPLLRRPPVLLAILVVLLTVAAVAGFLGVRSGSPEGLAGAAVFSSAPVTGPAAPPPALVPPGVAGSGSAGAGRTPAASGHAKVPAGPSALPAASVSTGADAPLVPAGDRLREVLPLLVQVPGCPGQTFGGSCYSVQPFTLPLSVVVPAGYDEARLADALQWTVRAQTVLGPVQFRGRGNHARVTVTDGGQATPPTIWTMQAALTVGGETHLSNEVTLRVYATT
ncbi:hypothetical protein AB0K00_32295 [Dactylosporangium sp. NPDC049525]|uniref:hypothetical protein n=1 Tax=Dactylosporangium sp. NPDC049525 TaxID=3154730 RepID=UPI003425A0F2